MEDFEKLTHTSRKCTVVYLRLADHALAGLRTHFGGLVMETRCSGRLRYSVTKRAAAYMSVHLRCADIIAGSVKYVKS